jgi:hypothetical protein
MIASYEFFKAVMNEVTQWTILGWWGTQTRETGALPHHVPRSFVPSPPGGPNILLKVTKNDDSTTQDREPVCYAYTVWHYRHERSP